MKVFGKFITFTMPASYDYEYDTERKSSVLLAVTTLFFRLKSYKHSTKG